MTEQLDAKAAEIRAMFSNQLEPTRTAGVMKNSHSRRDEELPQPA
jgi:hypothetical protein